MLERLRRWARRLRTETYALYLAYRDPRVPWYARAVAVLVVAYAYSPIDLIPDFIPVLGYLDDLLLVPLGAALVIRLIPGPVLAECRERARAELAEGRPVVRYAMLVVAGTWLLVAAAVGVVAWRLFA